MESTFLLDVVVREGPTILKLFTSENQSLLIWWDTLLILDFGLDVLNGVRWFNLKSNGLASEGLNENLHTTSKSQDKMEGRLLLDVVIRKSSSVLQLLSSEDQPLLVWWDTLLVLNLGLDVLDGVTGLDLQGDGLASQGLHKDLHTSSQPQHKMKGRLLLDVVIRKSSTIFQLLSSKDQPLLIWWDSFLVLDLGLDIFNGVGWLNLQGDSFTGEGLDKNLHTSSQSQNQMQCRFLLNVVVRQSSSILQLLSSEDQSLLIWWDSLLILDLGFDILNGIRWLNFQSNCLSCQSLDKDLHTSSQSEDQVKSRLLLDVVIGKSSSVLELFSGKDQSLLIWGNSLLILDLGLDVLNRVAGLNLEGDCLASKGLDENLHSSSQSQNQVKSGLLLDVVIGESSSVLELFSSEDEPLLIWWNAFLILNLGLHVLDRIRWLDFKGNGFPSEGFDENLHDVTFFVLYISYLKFYICCDCCILCDSH